MASLKSGQEIEKVPKYIPPRKKGARCSSKVCSPIIAEVLQKQAEQSRLFWQQRKYIRFPGSGKCFIIRNEHRAAIELFVREAVSLVLNYSCVFLIQPATMDEFASQSHANTA
jgi:hypothetical protein